MGGSNLNQRLSVSLEWSLESDLYDVVSVGNKMIKISEKCTVMIGRDQTNLIPFCVSIRTAACGMELRFSTISLLLPVLSVTLWIDH